MEVVILGSTGLLGTEVLRAAKTRDWNVIAPDRESVNLCDDRTLSAFFLHGKPDWIINCAAYTAVDAAESDKDAAFMANALGPFCLARYANWRGARLLHISTDFVFDGLKNEPYTEEDSTNPLGVYGASKKLGEESLLGECPVSIVARTAWLFGAAGECFPNTILHAARAGKQLRVVNDQTGSPTYSVDLAHAILGLIDKEAAPGIYHIVNSGEATWYDLAKEILTAAKIPADIQPITTAEWPTPAQRPTYSVLDTHKYQSIGLPCLSDWRDAVTRFIAEVETRAAEVP